MSNKEPEDKNIIWLKDRKLYIWDGGWNTICDQEITVNPEDITVDLSQYLKKSEAKNTYQLKGNYALKSDIPTIPKVPTKLSELNNDSGYITIKDISTDYVTKEQLKLKQNVLKSGYGIHIEDDVISSTLDLTLIKVVTELPLDPANIDPTKIYLVHNEGAPSNSYTEWIYIESIQEESGYWEKLGEYKIEVDLTPYALKDEVPTKVSELNNDKNYVTSTDFLDILNQRLEEYVTTEELPDSETYVLNFNVADGVNTGSYSKTEYDKLRAAIDAGKLIIVAGTVTRVIADSQAKAADYVVIRYSTPRISDDSSSVTISFYELKFGILDTDGTYKYQSKAIHKTI